MGRFVKLEEAGIAGTSAVAAGSVAVAANPGPLLDQGHLLGLDLGHLLGLLDQGHLELSLQLPLAPALEEIGERRLRKRIGSAQMGRVVAPAPPTPVPMTASCEVRQELIITTPMGISFLPLEAGIAGTSAVAAGSVAVAANPGPLLDQGLPLDLGHLLGLDLGHLLDLLDQGHLEAAETVTTGAPVVEVVRCPLVGPWDPVSLVTLVAAAAGLQESARIATRPSTASASSAQ